VPDPDGSHYTVEFPDRKCMFMREEWLEPAEQPPEEAVHA